MQAKVESRAVVQVLPEVYGGDAPLVPIEEAVAARLSAQQAVRKKHTLFGSKAAAGGSGRAHGGAAKSGRLASVGHAVARWSSSAWSLMKKPAQVGCAGDAAKLPASISES